MEENKNIKKELEDLSPWLHELKSKSTPERKGPPKDYFQNFEDRLMHRIQEEEALTEKPLVQETRLSSWWKRILAGLFQPKYAVGFSVAIIVVVFLTNNLGENPTAPETSTSNLLLAELSVEETTDYILNNIQDFETTEIMEVVEETMIDDEISEKLTITTIETVSEPNEVLKPIEEENTLNKVLEELEDEEAFLEELTEEEIEELDIF